MGLRLIFRQTHSWDLLLKAYDLVDCWTDVVSHTFGRCLVHPWYRCSWIYTIHGAGICAIHLFAYILLIFLSSCEIALWCRHLYQTDKSTGTLGKCRVILLQPLPSPMLMLVSGKGWGEIIPKNGNLHRNPIQPCCSKYLLRLYLGLVFGGSKHCSSEGIRSTVRAADVSFCFSWVETYQCMFV